VSLAAAARPAIVPPMPNTTVIPERSDPKVTFFASNTCQTLKTGEKYSYWINQQPQSTEAHPMTDSTLKLTARQSQILQLIQTSIARTGAPPTRAEIAQELGFKSANAAEEHLQALARKGAIELVSGTSRGIRLRSQDLQTINDARDRQMSLPLAGLSQLMLPLIGRVAAGSPILAQEHVDQTYHVERSLFTRQPDYLLKVRGMSMRDAGIMDGDLLAVHATQDVKNGQIVVARLGDDVTVKRFMRRAHAIELLAENPDYKTIVVEPGEPFAIEGIAVGLIRNGFQH
jgi:repressor LexA